MSKITKAELAAELEKARAYVRLVAFEAVAAYHAANRPLVGEVKYTDRDWGSDHTGERAHVLVRGEWYPFASDGGVVKVSFQPVNAHDGKPCGAALVEAYTFDNLWRLLRSTSAEDPQWTAPGRDMLRALLQRDAVREREARPTLRYRIHQISRDGTGWTSTECFEAVTEADTMRAVRAGWLHGDRRWATEERTGRFLGGLDGKGGALDAAPVESYAIVNPATGRSVAIYAPATRIYNPAPHLRLVPVCGMRFVQLAYDGATPMGWVEVTDEQVTTTTPTENSAHA